MTTLSHSDDLRHLLPLSAGNMAFHTHTAYYKDSQGNNIYPMIFKKLRLMPTGKPPVGIFIAYE